MTIRTFGFRPNHDSGSRRTERRSRRVCRFKKRLIAASFGILTGLLSMSAYADSPVTDFLSFYENESTGNYLKGAMEVNAAWFGQNNSWAGNAEELLGAESDFWGEYGLKLAIEGERSLGDYGSLVEGDQKCTEF